MEDLCVGLGCCIVGSTTSILSSRYASIILSNLADKCSRVSLRRDSRAHLDGIAVVRVMILLKEYLLSVVRN